MKECEMELLELLDKLRVDSRPEKEINIVVTIFGQLMQNLGLLFPNDKQMFIETNTRFESAINEFRSDKANVKCVFEGDGSFASKLKEYLNYSEVFGPEPSPRLKEAIELFNFHPTNDVVLNNELSLLLGSIMASVKRSVFKNVKPPLVVNGVPASHNVIGEIATGLYGDSGSTEDVTIVLRAKLPLSALITLEAIFIVVPNANPNLWYYHPLEKSWVQSDGTYTFVGLKEEFEKEFKIAYDEAEPVNDEFVFEKELNKLTELSFEIFNNEAVLPKSCSVVAGKVIKDDSVHAVARYANQGDCSFIQLRFGTMYELTFTNTKGSYPSRETTFVTKINNLMTRVEPSAVRRESQIFVIQTTSQALSALWNEIKTEKEAVCIN
jgi:hypothetical protein